MLTEHLQGDVGWHGVNWHEDVKLVQGWLNRHAAAVRETLIVDGALRAHDGVGYSRFSAGSPQDDAPGCHGSDDGHHHREAPSTTVWAEEACLPLDADEHGWKGWSAVVRGTEGSG